MKYIAKKPIPSSDSYKGLRTVDWERLNNGEEVELKKVPKLAKAYLTKKEMETNGERRKGIQSEGI